MKRGRGPSTFLVRKWLEADDLPFATLDCVVENMATEPNVTAHYIDAIRQLCCYQIVHTEAAVLQQLSIRKSGCTQGNGNYLPDVTL